MRKLLHIIFGVLKSGQPFGPDFLIKINPRGDPELYF